MDRKKIPHSFLKEYVPRIPILALGLFSFWLLHENWYWGLPCLLLCVAAGFCVERLQSKLKCPDCGAETSPHTKTKELGAPIEFYCRKCHVIWDTGRTTSRGVNKEKHWE